MASVREHYDRHLGRIYAWMSGDFDRATEAARAELRAAGINGGTGAAVDLGAGHGAHAIALADAGYAVTAIDTCGELLEELRSNAGARVITCVHDDLVDLRRHCVGGVDVVVCMGDTLTHLPSLHSVECLFDAVAEALNPGGVFVATFRDYSARALEDDARFIPVRHDDGRILTCFLEYRDAAVTVYDLLHERTDTGWAFRVSSYSKLRLAPEWARSTLNRRGLTTALDAGPRGMVRLTAGRPVGAA